MRRVLIPLFLVCVVHAGVAWGQTAPDASQIVAHKGTCNNQTPSGSVTTCAYTPTSTSNLLLVAVGTASSPITQTVTVSNGSCTSREALTSSTPSVAVYSCTITSTAAETVTDTLSSGNTATSFEIAEVSNLGTFDVGNTKHNSAVTSGVTGPAGTTTAQTDFFFSALFFIVSRAENTLTKGCQSLDVVSSVMGVMSATGVTGANGVTATGFSPDCTYTWTTVASANGAIVAFKSAVQAAIQIDTNGCGVFGCASSFTAGGTSMTVNLPSTMGHNNDCLVVQACVDGVMSSPTLTGTGDTCILAQGPATFNSGAMSEAIWFCQLSASSANLTLGFGATASQAVVGATPYTGSNGCVVDPNTTPSGANAGTGDQSVGSAAAGARVNDMWVNPACADSGISTAVNGGPMYDILGPWIDTQSAIGGTGGQWPITANGTVPVQLAIGFGAGAHWSEPVVVLNGGPTPTATATATATPTLTPTATATATAMPCNCDSSGACCD